MRQDEQPHEPEADKRTAAPAKAAPQAPRRFGQIDGHDMAVLWIGVPAAVLGRRAVRKVLSQRLFSGHGLCLIPASIRWFRPDRLAPGLFFERHPRSGFADAEFERRRL